jgi:alkane 1-monooxygenase
VSIYHYAKYYLTPLLAIAAMSGVLLGGYWMWLGFWVLLVIVVGGDAFLGEDSSKPPYRFPSLIELPLHLALPLLTLLLISFAWSLGTGEKDFLKIGATLNGLFPYDFLAGRDKTGPLDHIGGLISVGFTVAGYGTNVAHELTHRVKSHPSMFEGRWILSMSCNSDFSIEHVYGHHVTVGTEEDPATARRGENVYLFFLRSTLMGHLSAWRLELRWLRKNGQSNWFWDNRMTKGYLMSLVWVAMFFYAGGVKGLLFFLGQALFAKFILEVVNYMEHYGLWRRPDEPIRPHHSWNTNKRMSGMVLYSLTRHSAHHEKPRIPFWNLDPYTQAPQMPYGYLTTIFVCLLPPLWYRVIDPGLRDWDLHYAA